jgi:hypothetical protein
LTPVDFKLKTPSSIRAMQVTVDSLEAVEAWCGGQIKGVKLPAHQRVIDFQARYGEKRAEIGDWIVRSVYGDTWVFWDVYSNVEFVNLFERA